jgi:NADPH:quinone reductase-like Zn-dependent oxidoreductase
MQNSMMRWETPAVGLSNLRLATVPRPVPKAGEILVKVEAVSLNYRDTEVLEDRMGYTLDYPFTPVSDMAGTVVDVGDGVTRFVRGDRVVSMCITNWIDGASLDYVVAPPLAGPLPGVLAEYIAMPAEWFVRAPNSLTAGESSTLPIAALTAWMALQENDHIGPGKSVVVQGTGGVSIFAIQFGLVSGAEVIVTTGSASKSARLRELGVRHILNRHETPEWQNAVRELTDGKGADHVLEMAGGENFGRSVEAVKTGGRISLIGFLESYQTSFSILPVLGKRVIIEGISVGPRRAMEDMVRAIDQHGIKPVIDATYTFDKTHDAFAHLARGAFGKIVIELAK